MLLTSMIHIFSCYGHQKHEITCYHAFLLQQISCFVCSHFIDYSRIEYGYIDLKREQEITKYGVSLKKHTK